MTAKRYIHGGWQAGKSLNMAAEAEHWQALLEAGWRAFAAAVAASKVQP